MHHFANSPYREAAIRFSPKLYMDRREPFKPIRVGVTVFESTALSPSFDRTVTVDQKKVRMVIEYAIYWDYDIQHLYDLEHVWVYVDHEGIVASCEASFHGRYLLGLLSDRSNLSADQRVRLFVQPGKHAMSPLEELFRLLPNAESCCLEEAGKEGLLEPGMFSGQYKTAENADRLAEVHLQTFRFQPSFDYVPYEWSPDAFASWEELREEIPLRMKSLLSSLEERQGG
jgi:hypothetical protein